MNLSNKKIAIIALISANIIWGVALPIYKWSLESIHPFTFAFIRFFIATLILTPFVLKNLKFDARDFSKLIFGTLISITFQIPLLFFGLKFAPSINAPIIIASGPIILIGTSIIFLKEKVSKKLFFGTLISLLGVLTVIVSPSLASGFGKDVLGNLFVFLATICGVIQALVLKKILERNEALPTLFYSFLIGSLTLLPATLIEFREFGMFAINNQTIFGIIYASIASSLLAYYLWMMGLKYIKAAEIGIFSYVDPIATILVAVPLLHETISESYMIAALLVFGGIFIAEGRLHYHPLHRLFKN